MNNIDVISLDLKLLLNFLIDEYMPKMSSSEFKVYLYLYRKTIGTDIQMTALTLSQFINGTGLTKNTVIKAIRSLEEQLFIYKVEGYNPYRYMLNYSTIYAGDGSKYKPYALTVYKVYMTSTPITTGFPEDWESTD